MQLPTITDLAQIADVPPLTEEDFAQLLREESGISRWDENDDRYFDCTGEEAAGL
jgi:hypothetical protein